MTKLASPPRRESRLKIQALVPADAPDNLAQPTDAEVLVDLNFKVPPEFRHQFKMEATARKIRMKDFIQACFQAYIQLYGSKFEPK